MRFLLPLFFFAGCCVTVAGQDVKPVPDPISTPRIILPMTPVLVEPDVPRPQPKPQPEFQPQVISEIEPDEVYVVESTIELIVLQSPIGHLKIENETGPIKVRGKFCDGTGVIETRTYTSQYVYFCTGAKPGVCELILIPVGVMTESDIVRQVLTVSGQGPKPPPIDPDVPDPPGPITPQKLQVVIIEDPALRGSLPPEQIAIMDGAEVREYCKTHCAVTGTTPDRRTLSLRQDVSQKEPWVKEAFAQPRTSVPWLVIITPTQVVSGALPLTVADMMTELRKYGGP